MRIRERDYGPIGIRPSCCKALNYRSYCRLPLGAIPSTVQLTLQTGPAVEDGHDLVLFLGRQGEDDTVDADVLAKLQPVEIVGSAEDADRQARRVAAGVGRHLAELVDRLDALGLQPVVARDPAVAVAERALGGVFEPAADDDRRVGA